MKSKRVEFQVPQGVVPEGTEAGEDFDLVSTFRLKGDGSCCLVQMGDVKMPGYDDKADYKPDYSEEAQSMQQMGGQPNAAT